MSDEYYVWECVCLVSRDHRRLYVGDSRGRVFSWTVSDTQGMHLIRLDILVRAVLGKQLLVPVNDPLHYWMFL